MSECSITIIILLCIDIVTGINGYIELLDLFSNRIKDAFRLLVYVIYCVDGFSRGGKTI
jgi:hypothetical protein